MSDDEPDQTDEGSLADADWLLSSPAADDDLWRALEAATPSHEELMRMLEAATPSQEEMTRMLEAATPSHEEMTRMLEAATPSDDEMRRLLEAATPSEEEMARLLDAIAVSEDDLARTFQQLQAETDLHDRLDQLRLADEVPAPMAAAADASAHEVAEWMNERLRQHGTLYQSTVARAVRRLFGTKHVYVNKNRNLGISSDVLTAFRELTPDVVWERRRRLWRLRRSGDPEDRRQVD